MSERVSESVSEIMQSEAKVMALQQELARATTDVKKWKLEFSIDVEPDSDGTYNVVITGATGERGFRKIIKQQDVLYNLVDLQSLTKSISEEFLVGLLSSEANAALATKLSNAFTNVEQLAKKKGFAQ